MEYNVEFIKKILKDQEKEESRFKGICDIMFEHREPGMSEKTEKTMEFVKSRMPLRRYALVYDSCAKPIEFRYSESGGYRFASQEERIFFLMYLINELEYKPIVNKPEIARLALINNFKNFFKKIFKWQ